MVSFPAVVCVLALFLLPARIRATALDKEPGDFYFPPLTYVPQLLYIPLCSTSTYPG